MVFSSALSVVFFLACIGVLTFIPEEHPLSKIRHGLVFVDIPPDSVIEMFNVLPFLFSP